jgi:hypothetical protein
VTTRDRPRSQRPKADARLRRRGRASLSDRFELWLSTCRYVDGLWVGTNEGKPEPILRRVEAALTLIKAYDRPRYGHVLRDLDRVWVRVIADGLACYNAATNTCELDTRFVLAEASTPEVIAAAIVHEATHARLMRCGIGYEEGLRARVEVVCFRREIAFAARLPNGGEARERAERSLEFYSADELWTDAAFAERHLDGALAALRHLGAPEWLVRTVAAIFAWRHGIREPIERQQDGSASLCQRWPGRDRP